MSYLFIYLFIIHVFIIIYILHYLVYVFLTFLYPMVVPVWINRNKQQFIIYNFILTLPGQ
jgi:hypothetical protein